MYSITPTKIQNAHILLFWANYNYKLRLMLRSCNEYTKAYCAKRLVIKALELVTLTE